MTPTLQDCLMKLTAQELCELGFRLLVLPPEKRSSRKAWLEPLTEAMEGDPLDLLLCLTLEEWQVLDDYLHMMPDGLTIRFFSVNNDPDLKEAVEQLRLLGLCVRDQHAWHVHPKVQQLLRADQEAWRIMETAEELYAAQLGYLRIYGMLPAQDMGRMVAPLMKDKSLPKDVSPDEFMMGVWRRRNGLADVMMANDGLWLVCPDLEDLEALYGELHQPRMQMKPYASYSVEEAIACARGLPAGRSDAYDEVLAFYHTHGVDKAAALTAIDEAVMHFQHQRMEDAMAALVQPLSAAPTLASMRLLKLVFVRAPMWRMKGSCAEDLMSPDARISKRVRQNDPCPCGSGRKYKHCCGRLQ